MTTIYIRTLKRAEHTVFCVDKGQKTYYDPQFNQVIPYSSGQQVKRSIMDTLSKVLNEIPAPVMFINKLDKDGHRGEAEVLSICDPTYFDQLLGGWMKAEKSDKVIKDENLEEEDQEEKDQKKRTIKRRSPLSISAMRGLHPLLAGVKNESVSFDRSDWGHTEVKIRNSKGDFITSQAELDLLFEKHGSQLTKKWIDARKNARATGLFVQDIAIDLRRLFSVSLNNIEPEIDSATENKLREAGWMESENVFGKCLVAPQPVRTRLIPALAEAIVEWSITSNQARTFSLMETLAVTISDNANKIAASIRAKLSEEEDNKASPIVEEELDGVSTYVTLTAGGYIRTKSETFDALKNAKQKLVELMTAFDYEHQLISK